MNDLDIKNYIDLTAENTALKIEKSITAAIGVHEKNCRNQFGGRLELLETYILRSVKPSWATDQFGPILGALLKNWKAVTVVALLAASVWANLKAGRAVDKKELLDIIRHIQTVAEPADKAGENKDYKK